MVSGFISIPACITASVFPQVSPPHAEREEVLPAEPMKGPGTGMHWHYDVHLNSTEVIP